jgi:ribosome maturation factor RimP
MSTLDSVRSLAEPLVAGRGFELYDLEQHGPVVRVSVGAAPGAAPPGVDDLSSISRELSRQLDAADPISGRYTLEVSTPGLERKLRTPEHFAGAVGETVSVKVREPGQPTHRVRGVVLGADDHAVVVRVVDVPESDDTNDEGDPPSGELRLAFDVIDSARTVFEWGMTPPDPNPDPSVPAEGSTRRSDP